MVTFDNVQFNVDIVKMKGFDYFRTNILDLIARGKIGEMVEGKTLKPTESQIRAKYEEVTGLKVESKKGQNDG